MRNARARRSAGRRLALASVIVLSLPVLLLASLVATLLVLRAAWTVLDGPLPATELRSGPQATLVLDRHDRPVFSFSAEQRIDVPLERVSPYLVDAVLAAEDRRFLKHHGLDPLRIAAAAWRNYRAGRIAQGGSTITQQLARVLYLGHERTWRRKIREALMATDLEVRLTKQQILERYLNTIYFGEGFYGVEAAARGYFGKRAAEVSPAEAALLAGLIRSPSQSPRTAASAARARRDYVLGAMRRGGGLDEPQYRAALAADVSIATREHAGAFVEGARSSVAPADAREHLCGMYFFEEVRRELVAQFGQERVLRDGLRVFTTLDATLQREAEATLRTRIAVLGRKRRLLARELQGALVSMDARTGEVRAIAGGRDFHRSSYNRATQARRQPGSAFKPILFAAALERGFGPGSLLRDLDAPIDAAEGPWLPSGEHEAPEYTLRRALKVSSNRASAQLLQQIGVLPVIDYAQRLGIESRLPAVPSLALGTGGVTLLELVSAYAPFANRGLWVKPTFIRRVEDRHGNVLWHAPYVARQAISPSTAYLMSSMLREVIAGGTGYLARSMGFRRRAAGKTGTTDDFADAWFVGYTTRLVTGVWFGFDRPRTIFNGGFGGIVAVPAWTRFMMKATASDPDEWYEVPTDVEKVTICRRSGAIAREECAHSEQWAHSGPWAVSSGQATIPSTAHNPQPTEDEPAVYTDYFALGTGPSEVCPLHSAAPAPLELEGPASIKPAGHIR
ncbi:MAG TPA: PBP1A family penicillin-binding protein [Vicinamibacterales bacterium]|nr:PBP1A family penicillin-binding protein [Vicinamibacterales bacterium]